MSVCIVSRTRLKAEPMAALVDRRHLLLGGVALAAVGPALAAPLPVPKGNRLAFDVIRKGSKIGTHNLTFVPEGDRLSVHVAVDLAIGLGPITLFRYNHRAIETWRAGKVQAITATTNHDGYRHQLAAIRRDDGLWVEGDRGSYLAPPDTLPATHWNRGMLNGPMVNTETGALMHPKVTDRGMETLATTAGSMIRARHFSLSGDIALDTWYDGTPRWVGLAFTGGDGSEVRYRLASG
jgi:hypothetical protein